MNPYIIILVISFFLDGYIPNLLNWSINNLSIFSTVFTVIGISIITPYIESDKKYYLILLILGILVDIAWTNTLFLNMFLFIIMGLIIRFLYKLLSSMLLTNVLISIISITIYNVLIYFILVLCNYMDNNFLGLLKILYSSLISTSIYSLIINYILIKLDKKHKLKIIK